ncbi:type I polyketide synthase [Aquimarina sediminis]|uniref:type I polyketide synthase n=1 Tax=Aquimarina sediminis TaxID=2070536 RepID=UPI000C9FFEE7|nr:type I polyketide synthase [Aquimarina sediminis]
MKQVSENDIAIIGMAGRFPKAENIDEYWQNLVNGVNSICKADEEKIHASGISMDVLNHKRFVNASSRLEDAKYFDADFFGLSNSEALIMDPQIRLLLQTSWHAIEDAGYDVSRLDLSIGNFCGMSTNSYLLRTLNTNSKKELTDPLLYRILNEKDFLATWISYKLNLTGPAMSLQTACSTSLLAVHLACQSLLNYECDMALAGGVCFDSDQGIGYMHVPESIYSKDGTCRPFDSEASGTVTGDGVGTIVLKRATDAIKDKDNIYALIKGTATNNDGGNKQGYTTPSVNLQRDVILEAMAVADIHPETIGMIEAHGTGTLIGDPIEVSALSEAFRQYTKKNQYCAIGSVKSNIGHLDAAAGIASIIKAALCVNKGAFVPSINFSKPNPTLQLESSPFYVSQTHMPWSDHFDIRRAGVSSLGVGGTNVHIIVEEPPQIIKQKTCKRPFVIALSALNQNNLSIQKQQLAEHIRKNQEILLEDVEYTNIYGRKTMPHRFSAVCNDKEELIAQLVGGQNEKCYQGYGEISEGVFLFPGQGSQYPNMANDLYHNHEAIRKDMDYCFEYLKSLYQVDFKKIVFSDNSEMLNKTENTQVSLFIVEYCLAKELLKSGITPKAIIGHSLGEYVAACVVGCISLEDALKLVYHRGRLMGAMPKGAMLLVQSAQSELDSFLLDTISISVFNTHDNIVVGGTEEDIRQQSMLFEINNIKYRALKVSHAYHTQMMSDVLDDYEKILSEIDFKYFSTKIFSTCTGSLVDPKLFCSKQYWLDQIVHPVKFLDAAKDITDYVSNPTFIEVGPGNGLSSFVKAIFDQQVSTVSLLPRTSTKNDSLNNFYEKKALLYIKGLVFDAPQTHEGKRISLPGYAFSKNYFWKPKVNIEYNDFKEITESYHHTNDKYLSDRLRSSIEVVIADKNKVSVELLSNLNDLHTRYLNDIKKLFHIEDEEVHDTIEVLYDNISFHKENDSLPNGIELSNKRNVNNVFVEPETDIEKSIAKHWSGILGYHPVGVLDNYFEVGGNSLLATQLINEIMKEINVELTIVDVLSNSTIKDLALIIEEKQWLSSEDQLSNELII